MPGFLNFIPIVLMIVMLIMLIGLLGLVISDVISEANLRDIFSWRFQKRKAYTVADDSLCDMLEIILSDLDKYKSCISYNSYCLYIRIDVEETYYIYITLNYDGKLTITTPEDIRIPKSREKTLKKLITRAINEIEASDNNKKLTKVRGYLSSALNPTTNQHKTPEVLDIDE